MKLNLNILKCFSNRKIDWKSSYYIKDEEVAKEENLIFFE